MTEAFKMKVSKGLLEAKRDLKLLTEAHVAKRFGISEDAATAVLKLSWTKNEKAVPDSVFRKIAEALHLEDEWIINTNDPNIRKVMAIADMARKTSDCYAIAALPGRGKTEGAKEYARKPEVFHVQCNKYYTQKVFLMAIMKAMKITCPSEAANAMAERIVESLNSRYKPLLIIDEADKLQDNVFQFFITLYNDTKGNCGLVFMGSVHFEKKVERGVARNRQGYAEFYSRIGGKFEHINDRTNPKMLTDAQRIDAICRLNGLSDAIQIQEVINTSKNDMRQVKRKVMQFKLRNELQKEAVA